MTENTSPAESRNLAYEVSLEQENTNVAHSFQLAYWRWGLDAACTWKKLLNQSIPEKWTTVAQNLALPPQADGIYADYEGLDSSWWDDSSLSGDTRSLIMLQGILPDTPAIDPGVALRTAEKVWKVWTEEKIFGWGRPVLAINAVRLGRPERAIQFLTNYNRWVFDDAGTLFSCCDVFVSC